MKRIPSNIGCVDEFSSILCCEMSKDEITKATLTEMKGRRLSRYMGEQTDPVEFNIILHPDIRNYYMRFFRDILVNRTDSQFWFFDAFSKLERTTKVINPTTNEEISVIMTITVLSLEEKKFEMTFREDKTISPSGLELLPHNLISFVKSIKTEVSEIVSLKDKEKILKMTTNELSCFIDNAIMKQSNVEEICSSLLDKLKIITDESFEMLPVYTIKIDYISIAEMISIHLKILKRIFITLSITVKIEGSMSIHIKFNDMILNIIRQFCLVAKEYECNEINFLCTLTDTINLYVSADKKLTSGSFSTSSKKQNNYSVREEFKKNGGKLLIYEKEDKGTIFEFTIPSFKSNIVDNIEFDDYNVLTNMINKTSFHNDSIIIADDSLLIIKMLFKRINSHLGISSSVNLFSKINIDDWTNKSLFVFHTIGEITFIYCSNGLSAYEFYRIFNTTRFITDIEMPKMTGAELMREVDCRQRTYTYPDVKYLIVSAVPEEKISETYISSNSKFLQKGSQLDIVTKSLEWILN